MNNVSLFPMQALSSVMRESGFEFPNARKAIAFALSSRVGYDVKITPKFHECFNFIADVVKGRVRPSPRHDVFRVCEPRDIRIFEDLAFSMEPAQVASFYCLTNSPVALGEALMQHLHTCYPNGYPEPSLLAGNDRIKEVVLSLFNDLHTAWSSR